MTKFKTKALANIIFVAHTFLVAIILFGWCFPKLANVYMLALALTLSSELILGYCILTKWEFDLRKKIEPDLNYNYSFISYYAYKYFRINPPAELIKYASVIFLVCSIIALYAKTRI